MRKRIVCLIVMMLFAGFLVQAEEKKKEITLKDAIYHALKNNLDLQIQMTDVDNAQRGLTINKSIFIPTIDVTGTTAENNTPSADFLSGGAVVKRNQQSLTLGVTQQLPFGGNVNFSLTNRRTTSNSIWAQQDPSLASQATLTLNQPLLKGFGLTPTKRQIYISANNLRIAKHQLKENIMTLVYNVEDAYWNLVFAHQNLEATKMALKRSRDLLKQNEIKVKVGSAAPIEILTAKAEVARNESTLIQALNTIRTGEQNLKKVLNMDRSKEVFIPTDKPEIDKLDVDFNDFLLEGLNNRPDVERAKLDLANQKIGVKYAKNQLLPELGLNVTYFTTGQGGDLLDYLPGKSPLMEDFNRDTDTFLVGTRNIWKTMDDVFSQLYKNYNVSLNLQIPVSFAKEKAELAQARIAFRRSMLNLKKVENTVYSEVKEVIDELEANAKLVEADRIAMDLENKKLEAELKRLAVGLTTNFYVLDYQRAFTQAETTYLRTVINYNMTLAKINRRLARTFKAYDIKFKDFVK